MGTAAPGCPAERSSAIGLRLECFQCHTPAERCLAWTAEAAVPTWLFRELVDLGGHDEVALGQAVDLVRP